MKNKFIHINIWYLHVKNLCQFWRLPRNSRSGGVLIILTRSSKPSWIMKDAPQSQRVGYLLLVLTLRPGVMLANSWKIGRNFSVIFCISLICFATFSKALIASTVQEMKKWIKTKLWDSSVGVVMKRWFWAMSWSKLETTFQRKTFVNFFTGLFKCLTFHVVGLLMSQVYWIKNKTISLTT